MEAPLYILAALAIGSVVAIIIHLEMRNSRRLREAKRHKIAH